jgi:hypothetical protein
MAFQPITITRMDSDHYIVGRVNIRRVRDDVENGLWAALPPGEDRPLFTAPTLEEILDMAHGATEMMRPATPSRHRDDYDPEPDYDRPTRYDIGPDGQV